MNLEEILTVITQLAFINLAIITAINYFNRRDLIRRDIALLFASIAIPLAIQFLTTIFPNIDFTVPGLLGTFALIAQPYLLVRLAGYIHPVPRNIRRLAIFGMLLSWFVLFDYIIGLILPEPAVLLLVVYFVIIDGYAMLTFIRGAIVTSGVLQKRLRFVATGSGLFALVLGIIGIVVIFPSVQAIAQIVLILSALLSAICFYLGFATPSQLRRIWQFSELHDFLVRTNTQISNNYTTLNDIVYNLCLEANRIMSASHSIVIIDSGDRETWQIISHPKDTEFANGALDNNPQIRSVLQTHQPKFITQKHHSSVDDLRLLDTLSTQSLILVPVITPHSNLGVLLVGMDYITLFPEDDIEFLLLLTRQTAVFFENSKLIDQLHSYSHQLERTIQERTQSLQASEEQFRSIFEQAAVGIAKVSFSGQILQANEQFLSTFDYTASDLEHTSMQKLGFTDFDETIKREQSEDHPSNPVKEYPFFTRTKQPIWCNVVLSTVYDALDKPDYLIVVIQNITEQKLSKAEQLKTESRFVRVLDTTAEAVISIDKTQKILLFNRSAERIFQYQADEIINQPLAILLPLDIIDIHHQFIEGFAEGHDVSRGMGERNRKLSARRKDGTIFPIEASISKLTEDEDVILTVFIRDITEQERIEEQNRRIETQFARVLDTTAEAVISINHEHHILLFNASAEHIFGYEAHEVMDQKLDILLPPEVIGHHSQFIEEFARGDDMSRGMGERNKNLFARRKDGTIFPIEASISKLTEGKNVILTVFIRDITDRIAAEEARRESEKLLRNIITNLPTPVAVSSIADGTLLFANEVFGHVHNIVVDDYIGKTIPEAYVNLEERQIVMDLFRKHNSIRDYEIQIKRINGGEMIWVAVSIVPMVFNNIEALLSTFIDITERKKVADVLKDLNQELEERINERTVQLQATIKELEAFSYSVSHDLRAPLRATDGFSQALLEDYYDVIDDDGKEYLSLIRLESQKMGQLIDDLLELSRLTRRDINKEAVDLTGSVKVILNELRQLSPERPVEFVVEENLTACADTHLLLIALRNLLENAWKYSSKKEFTKIEFGTTLTEGETVFFVRDNGAGFNIKYADKLFGAFQRLHGRQEFEGTGIGLATVQRIINRHGGKIWAEGVEQEGATFYFTVGYDNCE